MPDNGTALERREAQGSSQGPARPDGDPQQRLESPWAAADDFGVTLGRCKPSQA